MLEQKTGDLPEWEKRSTSQEIAQEEISNEETLLMEAYKSTNEYFNELYQLTRLVYVMLRYTMAVDRIIPLLKKMGRDFAEGEK